MTNTVMHNYTYFYEYGRCYTFKPMPGTRCLRSINCIYVASRDMSSSIHPWWWLNHHNAQLILLIRVWSLLYLKILRSFSGQAPEKLTFFNKHLSVDYVYIEKSFDNIYNMGYGSGNSPIAERVKFKNTWM